MHKYISQLSRIVGQNNVVTNAFELQTHNTDWMSKYRGQSECMVTPTSTAQVSELMTFFNANNIKVVPQGGNTGLVGGGVPIHDEVILSMSKMNKIHEFNSITSVLTAQSGSILQNLNEYLQPYRYQMPWDLGARGSCQLGGNISTNAGGLNVVRNGLLRNYILGLEVVLPNGKILDMMSTNRKDNTGVDLKQLFIGAEGTLGIVTQANVLCTRIPNEQKVFFMELNSYKAVIDLLNAVKSCEQLNAFEFMEGRILQHSAKHSNSTAPFNFDSAKYYVLLEFAGSSIDVDSLAEMLMQHSQELVMNNSEAEAQTLWKWREGIAEMLCKLGLVLKYDLSIPPEKFEWFVEQVYPNRDNGPLNMFYGHIGDGNIHFNVVLKDMTQLHEEEQKIEQNMFQLVRKLGGSISAEHGIGQHKTRYMNLQKGVTVLDTMKQLKSTLDPNMIMNPGKVFE